MPTGIKYLKIAKIDATGVDRSDNLRYLDTFRLSFTDLGLVTFLVIDRIEYSNYFQFTVNPIAPLPGGAITSSDNRVYNYTSSIPDGNIPFLPTIKSGSLTQALEITDLALSGGYSNWDDFVSTNPSEAKDEFNGSTVYGLYQRQGSIVDFGYDRFSNPSYNWGDVVGINVSLDYPLGLETSTFLFNRLEAAGEFVNVSESIELPPQLTLITSSGVDYGTNIRINRTPNAVVPFAFTVAWCNVDRATFDTNFYQAYNGIIPSSGSSIPTMGGPIFTNYYPGKVYLGCYKNGTLQNYVTSSIVSQSGFVFLAPNDKTAIVQYSSSLNELNVVKGDELSFKLFGYSNYATNGQTVSTSIIVGKLSGSTCVEGFTVPGFTNAPPAISESFRNATQTPDEVFAGPPSASLVSPFLSIEEFSNSGADVLMNNVDSYPPNPFLQDLDYNSSQTVPVNYEAILNNTATKATVPESNYTQLSSANIRYNGSKIQSQILNRWTTQNNIGTYGKTPSINSFDTNIYEFEWGGGTTPEILGWGALKMGKILKVQSTGSITTVNQSDGLISRTNFGSLIDSAGTVQGYRTISPGIEAGIFPNSSTGSLLIPSASNGVPNFKSQKYVETPEEVSDYYYILNNNLPTNSEITPTVYETLTESNPIYPKTSKIATSEFGVPSISSYAATSSRSTKYGQYSTSGGGFGFINIEDMSSLYLNSLTRNSNGYYTDEGVVDYYIIQDTINRSLNAGERWFVTLFNSFEYPTGNQNWDQALDPILSSGSLTPYNVGYNIPDEFGNYPNPLAYKGVHEILGVQIFQGLQIILSPPKRDVNGNITYSSTNIGGNTVGNSLGMLIWKAEESLQRTQFVIIQDNVTGVSAGAFTNRYTPQEITNNLEQITKEFGSNKQ